MPRIDCPNCGHNLRYADEHAGRKAKCQKCGHAFRLPESPADAGPTAARPGTPSKAPEAAPGRPAWLAPAEVTAHRGDSGGRYTEAKSLLSVLDGHFRSDSLACQYVISPDGWRVFHSGSDVGFWGGVAMMAEGRRVLQMLDGKPFDPGHEYDPSTFVFSADGRHHAYAAGTKGGMFTKGAAFLVLDGAAAGERFDEVRDIALSGGGESVAFVARVGRRWHVIHDGRAGPAFDTIHEKSLVIARDGSAISYSGVRGKQTYAVLGGEEWPVTGRTTDALSPDGAHGAWVEKEGRATCVVVDGRPGPAFDEIPADSLRLSQDGARVAYAARRGNRWHAVLDGEAGVGYAAVDPKSLALAPDGRRFAYAACAERSWLTGRGDWRVVVDGVDQPVYAEVKAVRLSPDGSRVGYAAADRRGTHLVVDGRPEGCWADLSDLTFSPDGRRYACVATAARSGDQVLVVDGRGDRGYTELTLHGFTPDGSHAVATAFGSRHAKPTPNWPDARDVCGFLVVDGDYESRAFVSTRPAEPPNSNLFRVVRIGFSGPRSVYAVSVFINEEQVHFDRLDVSCP